MSEIKYTGKNALIYLLTLIKNNFVQKDGNKVLSDNNLTDELLAKIQGDGDANIIESISVNGNTLTPDGNKNVNISVPEVSTNIETDATNDIKAVSPRAVKSYVSEAIADIQGIEYKILADGEYADGAPTVTGEKGVIYLVPISGGANNSYEEFIYDGTNFERIGTTEVNLDGYVLETELVEITNTEIDEIYNSIS
jgi:hypothetical protein